MLHKNLEIIVLDFFEQLKQHSKPELYSDLMQVLRSDAHKLYEDFRKKYPDCSVKEVIRKESDLKVKQSLNSFLFEASSNPEEVLKKIKNKKLEIKTFLKNAQLNVVLPKIENPELLNFAHELDKVLRERQMNHRITIFPEAEGIDVEYAGTEEDPSWHIVNCPSDYGSNSEQNSIMKNNLKAILEHEAVHIRKGDSLVVSQDPCFKESEKYQSGINYEFLVEKRADDYVATESSSHADGLVKFCQALVGRSLDHIVENGGADLHLHDQMIFDEDGVHMGHLYRFTNAWTMYKLKKAEAEISDQKIK